MIKTKSLYDTPSDSDGRRILVTRYYPPFAKSQETEKWYWNPLLAPPAPLIKRFKAGQMSEKNFIRHYKGRTHQPQVLEEIRRLAEAHRSGETVTLLCYEKEGDFCHRHILKERILEEAAR